MGRQLKKIHYIYKTTCVVTGRYYIGMHSTCNLDDGYMGSGKRLRYSIRKHGIENHVKVILEYFETRESLLIREKELVTLDLIKDAFCMNLKEGGSGGLSGLSDNVLQKIREGASKHQLNKWKDEKYKTKISGLLAECARQAHIDGKKKYDNFKNKTHSDESKDLMSKSSKGMGVGKENSQFGTCWITKDGLNKKIKKEELDSHQLKGWSKGRTHGNL